MKTKVQQLFVKHNKKIAACVASAIFVGLFLSVVFLKQDVMPCTKANDTKTVKDNDVRKQLRNVQPKPCVFNQSECHIDCTLLPSDEIQDYILGAYKQGCDSKLELVIKETQFPDNIITSGWLKKFPSEITILTLQKCTFNLIMSGAFTGHPFNLLQVLTIIGSQINYLRRESFEKMNSLTTFSLQGTDDTPVEDFRVEIGVLGNLNLLSTIQIHKRLTSADHVFNLTGHIITHMTKLQILDLRYNSIDELRSYTFINANILQSLFLSDNKLQRIPKEAFWNVNLKIIDIHKNQLRSLENGTFKDLKVNENGPSEQLFVSENPWLCTCSLQWLKDLYLENSLINRTKVLRCNGITSFDDTDFGCSETTTIDVPTNESVTDVTEGTETTPVILPTTEQPITTEQTIQPTDLQTTIDIITTTPAYDDFHMHLTCKNLQVTPVKIPTNVIRYYMDAIDIPVMNHMVRFIFYDLDDKVTTEADIVGNLENVHLIWFNTKDRFETSCISGISRKVPLENLRRDNTYTICLLPRGHSTVSPYSCFGLRVPEDYNLRSWIPNKHKTTFIAVSISVLILCVIIVAASVFYCIRQYPNLIRGNKRVIIVGKKKSEAIIIPKDYETPVYLPSSTYPGYLTPKFPLYERVRHRVKRRVSENSISSYITELSPRTRATTIHSRKPDLFYEDTSAPPPLPPFHPTRRHCDVNDSCSTCS